MKDLTRFGTEDHPLHCSGLHALVRCPWRSVLMYLFADDDEGGVAGDTGSALHKAAATLHTGNDPATSLEVMQGTLHKYPKADLQDAAGMFLTYSLDDRNRAATYLLIEQQVRFQIAPSPDDPTGAPIQVVGTLDQVRLTDGVRKLWDIKTSKKDPLFLLRKHQMQLAAYCIGASIHLGQVVQPGGIICPRRYKLNSPSTSPVFYHCTWTFEDIERILLPVRRRVAEIRGGVLYSIPNEDCDWCVARSPDICFPKLKAYLKSLEVV